MCLDSGATKSCISLPCYAAYFHNLIPDEITNLRLRSFNNTCINVLGKVRVPLTFGTFEILHEFLIVGKAAIHDLLLGMDFFEENQVILNVAQGFISMHNMRTKETETAKIYYGNSNNEIDAITLKKSVTIPPSSELIVEGRVGSHLDLEGMSVMVDKYIPLITNQGVITANALVTVKQGNKFPVSVLNIHNKPIKLSAKTRIGTLFDASNVIASINLRKGKYDDFTEPYIDTDIDGTNNEIDCNIDDDAEEPEVPEGVLHPDLKIDMSSNIPLNKQNELKNLLIEYRDIWCTKTKNLPQVRGYKYHIELIPHTARKFSPYALSEPRRAKLREIVTEMLQANLITPVVSDYASPVTIICRPGSRPKLCIDYRFINSVTVNDVNPLPRMNDLLETMARKNFITTCDVMSAYHTVPLTYESSLRAAFCINESVEGSSLFAPKCLVYGLKCAPASYVRLMSQVMSGLLYDKVLCYLDDIAIVTDTIDEHIETLREVFKRLRIYNIKLTPRKFQLLKDQVKFLGHSIRDNKIYPDKSKIEIVEKYPCPNESRNPKKSLHSFLSLCNYYRGHIKDYAKMSAKLYDLIKINTTWSWNDTYQKQFDDIKKAMINSPPLVSPNYDKEFILKSDASDRAIGAILTQLDDNNVECIIEASGVKFSTCQLKWHIFEKETFALLWALRHFRKYIEFSKCTCYVDNAALSFTLKSKSQTNARILRWQIELSSYRDIVIKHRKGKESLDCDALSRIDHDKIELSNNNDLEKVIDDDDFINICSVSTKTLRRSPRINKKRSLPLEQDQQEKIEEQLDPHSVVNDEEIHDNEEQIDPHSVTDNDKNHDNEDSHSFTTDNIINKDLPTDTSTNLDLQNENDNIDDQYTDNNDADLSQESTLSQDEIMNPVGFIPDSTSGMNEGKLLNYSAKDLYNLQKEDTLLGAVIKYLELNEMPSNKKSAFKMLSVAENCHMHEYDTDKILCMIRTEPHFPKLEAKHLICVPEILQYQVCLYIHQEAHFGPDKCFSILRTQYYIKNAYSIFEKIYMSCQRCLSCRPNRKLNSEMQITDVNDVYNGSRIMCDHLGPLSISKDRNGVKHRYVLALIDSYSRFLTLYPCSDLSAVTTATLLREYFLTYGIPKEIFSDNASSYKNVLVKELMEQLGIKHRFFLPYSPCSNRQERSFKDLVKTLRTFCYDNQYSWATRLTNYSSAINNTPKKCLANLTPANVFLNRPTCNRPLGNLKFKRNVEKDPVNFVQQNSIHLRDAYDHVEQAGLDEAQRNKTYFDNNRCKMVNIVPNDIVYVSETRALVKGNKGETSKKLSARFHGPLLVIKRVGVCCWLVDLYTRKPYPKSGGATNIRRLRKGSIRHGRLFLSNINSPDTGSEDAVLTGTETKKYPSESHQTDPGDNNKVSQQPFPMTDSIDTQNTSNTDDDSLNNTKAIKEGRPVKYKNDKKLPDGYYVPLKILNSWYDSKLHCRLYKVQWKGFSKNECTAEKRETLPDSLVDNYESKLLPKKSLKK